MRVLAVLLFGMVIFIFTCTKDFHDLLLYHQIDFEWNHHPDFSKFFDFTSYPFQSSTYVLQKTGHALCFFIFSFLLSKVTYTFKFVFTFGVSYAFITEVAQLFFSRTGCLLDVLYDSVGVLSYCTALLFISKVEYFQKGFHDKFDRV
jgi:VanZ family protein